MSSRREPVTSAHWVAPRRSAYDVWLRTRRSRTCPTGSGTSATSRCTSKPPISPRWMCTTRSASKSRKRCLPADSAVSSVAPSSCAASAANRPWGLLTRTGPPAKASVNAVASRCRVWPSGMAARGSLGVLGGGGQRRQVVAGLVVGQHRDPPHVALLAGERGLEEQTDEARHLVHGVHPAADRDHVGVVVLAGEHGGVVVPDERRTDAPHLVGRDLLAVPRAADDDAQAARVSRDALGRPEAEHGVVVLGVVGECAVVDGLVVVVSQPVNEVLLELEAGVVGAQVDAHAASVPVRPDSVHRPSTLGA